MPSLISLSSGLKFSLKNSLVSFVKFVPRYFIVFQAIANGIISLISFSGYSLLIYRKATDFCVSFVSCYFTERNYDFY
jgi:hypothetical protein